MNKTLKAFVFVMSAVVITLLIGAFISFSIEFFGDMIGAAVSFTVFIAILTLVVRSNSDD